MASYVSGVGARTTGGEGPQGAQANTTVSGDSGQSQAQPVGNVATASVPLQPAVSGTPEPTIGVSQPLSDSSPVSVVSATLEPTIGISRPPSDSFPYLLQYLKSAHNLEILLTSCGMNYNPL